MKWKWRSEGKTAVAAAQAASPSLTMSSLAKKEAVCVAPRDGHHKNAVAK